MPKLIQSGDDPNEIAIDISALEIPQHTYICDTARYRFNDQIGTFDFIQQGPTDELISIVSVWVFSDAMMQFTDGVDPVLARIVEGGRLRGMDVAPRRPPPLAYNRDKVTQQNYRRIRGDIIRCIANDHMTFLDFFSLDVQAGNITTKEYLENNAVKTELRVGLKNRVFMGIYGEIKRTTGNVGT